MSACKHDFSAHLERAVAAHETPPLLECACGAKRLPTDDEIARLLHWTPEELARAEEIERRFQRKRRKP